MKRKNTLVKDIRKGKICMESSNGDSTFEISEDRESELLKAIQTALHKKDITRYELLYILRRLENVNEMLWLTIGEIRVEEWKLQ